MVKTYNPKEVTVAFGNHIVTGFADDSFISIEQNGDGITKVVGCDGEIARSISPDGTYKVKISLLQTSGSNSVFQNAYLLDRETGDGLQPLLIKDLKGGMVFSTDAAWVIKSVSRTYGNKQNNREWELETGDADLTE